MSSASPSARPATGDRATTPVPAPPAATDQSAARPGRSQRPTDPASSTLPPPPPPSAAAPAATDHGQRRTWCIGPPAHLVARSATGHDPAGQPDRTGGVDDGDTGELPRAEQRSTRDQHAPAARMLRTLLGS